MFISYVTNDNILVYTNLDNVVNIIFDTTNEENLYTIVIVDIHGKHYHEYISKDTMEFIKNKLNENYC